MRLAGSRRSGRLSQRLSALDTDSNRSAPIDLRLLPDYSSSARWKDQTSEPSSQKTTRFASFRPPLLRSGTRLRITAQESQKPGLLTSPVAAKTLSLTLDQEVRAEPFNTPDSHVLLGALRNLVGEKASRYRALCVSVSYHQCPGLEPAFTQITTDQRAYPGATGNDR